MVARDVGMRVDRLATSLAAAGVLLAISAGARAETPIKIGSGYGTACATGCLLSYGETSAIGNGEFSLYLNGANAAALDTTTLVILGVPSTFPTLGTGVLSNPASLYPTTTSTPPTAVTVAPGPSDYGLTSLYSSQSTGQISAQMTSGSTNVYSLLGLTGTSNSNSFTNWQKLDSSVLPALYSAKPPTAYNIYVYGLNTQNFVGHSLVNVNFSSLPQGTIVNAFEQSGTGSSATTYATAFTDAGLECSSVNCPEPAGFAVLGTGLVGLGIARRRRNVRRA